MNLKNIASNIELKNGIWYQKTHSQISYPDEGNENCFQIEDNSFWFKHRNNCLLEIIKKFPFTGSFFDIGGGNGFVAQAIEKTGKNTVLVEPGEKGIRNAKKRNLKNLVCATLEGAEFKKGSIDAIGVFDVIEHIKEDEQFIKNLHAYLKQNGKLYLTVPAYQILWSREDDFAGHFRRYTIKTISQKLKKAGFKMEFSTYIFSILPLPIFLFRSLPSKLKLYKGHQINEHKEEHSKQNKILTKIWNWEVKRLSKGKKIPFGGSCLIVAKK
ncbi:MAG: Methyltransferase type 12 [Candidatus Peregrinibacteria bacterium GW2011_GWA2_33_10]|nr:MAG: Methyltransferase type 12 [Candidatus Peregrinibacteria bacterium GW2011_GWA2_33_10]KKP40911.1 MAG: type 12 methyltransferase [Candidatus Peregrinibacteria bacterium GW2011_GWC2_33_13]OGJ50148.1 MAG: hypothetical protein A2229_00270 [Candidatus Peregrinibacteria bacterium RIFOXYA2_FULL_33_7]